MPAAVRALRLAAVLLALTAPGAKADISHSGFANPVSEGWGANGDTALGSGSLDSFFGIPRWQIDDQSTAAGSALYYDAGEFPSSFEPWTLSALVRVVLGNDLVDQGIFMEVTDASHRRFLVWLGSQVLDGSSNPVPDAPGTTWIHLSDGSTPAIDQNSFEIPGGIHVPVRPMDYHLVELASNGPDSELLVDGVLVFGGYTGFTAPAVSPRVLWGAGSSSAEGISSWARIDYTTGLQACNNGLDDDGNGLVDTLDPWCASALDPREGPPPVPCSDVDFDGDGICDWNEPEVGTDPRIADTDGDGVDDGAEVLAGTNPLVPPEIPALPATAAGILAAVLVATGARRHRA